ncbi:MAG: peptidylprolyl isomerase [Planctomycetota bacterium]
MAQTPYRYCLILVLLIGPALQMAVGCRSSGKGRSSPTDWVKNPLAATSSGGSASGASQATAAKPATGTSPALAASSAAAAAAIARASSDDRDALPANRAQARANGLDEARPLPSVRRLDSTEQPTQSSKPTRPATGPAPRATAPRATGQRATGPRGSLQDEPTRGLNGNSKIDPYDTRTVEKAAAGIDSRHEQTRTAELIDDLPSAAEATREFAPAQTVAIIGRDHILAGDIDGMINLMLAPTTSKMSAEELDRARPQIDEQKKLMFRQQLQGEVQTKLGYLDFMRQVPPDKANDLQKRINESFEKDLETVRQRLRAIEAQAKQEAEEAKANPTVSFKETNPNRKDEVVDLARRDPILFRLSMLMNQAEIETLGDLDQMLRRYGSSLEKQQRAYGEHKLMQMSVMKNVRKDVEVTHEQMLSYYREHLEDYAIPARVKWEEIMVRFDRHPNEEAATTEISTLGNEVYLGGATLAAVAKRSSHGPTAAQGGQYEWTDRGSLASKVIEDALFDLPLNQLSQIIRDERGLHIVRVLERTEATYVPFLEAQVEIKEKIRGEYRQTDVQNYLNKLKKTTNVWTIFDDQ